MARRLIESILKPSRLRRNYCLTGDTFFPASFSTSRSRQASETDSESQNQSKHNAIAKTEERLHKYVDPEVQRVLFDLTGMSYQKVFRNRKIGQKLREPKYSFMTEAELEEAVTKANERAREVLQMPPVLPPRKPINEIMSYDPIIQGLKMFEKGVTLMCTDISPGITDLDRLIVAREGDGTLRRASWEEREKMNKIYFPTPGKTFRPPQMFTDQKILKEVLARASPEDNVYEFALDRACLEFEPDDPVYISTVELVYETVDSLKHYDYLKSTRHYGPMVFHLTRFHRMDHLLIHTIKNERIPEAASLVSLFHLIFPECKSAQVKTTSDTQKISSYIEKDGILKSELTLILNSYLEQEKAKKDLEQGLERAHGLQ